MKAPAILALLLSTTPLAAQEMRAHVARLDSILPTIMDSAEVPGLTLVAFEKQKPVAWLAYGVRNSRSMEPVDTSTVFEAMSLTKQVVAYIAMRLADRKLLDLERPAYLYLPHPDLDDPRAKQVTLAMLLSHSSGLPNWRPQGGKLAFRFDPGTRFGYSGEGYVWLGMVIEKVTGASYGDVLQTELCAPLGLARTRYDSNREVIENRAQGYAMEAGRLVNDQAIGMSQPGAAGGILSTAGDLVRWQMALTSGKVVQPESFARMCTPTVLPNGHDTRYGFGLGLDEWAGMPRVQHGGGIFGIREDAGNKGLNFLFLEFKYR